MRAAATPGFDWLPAAIRQRSSARELASGETLFRQGDAAGAIYAVERGRVRLTRLTIDDHPVTLHAAHPGELFAEAALFSEIYHCDAVADIGSVVRSFQKPELIAAFRADPDLSLRFMSVLARQVMALRTRLELRNIRSARERVLRHLALAAGADGRTAALDGTVMDLAAEIGLTHEALYRTLAALERTQAIRRTDGAIVLLKPPPV